MPPQAANRVCTTLSCPIQSSVATSSVKLNPPLPSSIASKWPVSAVLVGDVVIDVVGDEVGLDV